MTVLSALFFFILIIIAVFTYLCVVGLMYKYGWERRVLNAINDAVTRLLERAWEWWSGE